MRSPPVRTSMAFATGATSSGARRARASSRRTRRIARSAADSDRGLGERLAVAHDAIAAFGLRAVDAVIGVHEHAAEGVGVVDRYRAHAGGQRDRHRAGAQRRALERLAQRVDRAPRLLLVATRDQRAELLAPVARQ